MSTATDTTARLVEVLSYHHLFRLLQGNPTSLTRAANVFRNPFNDVISLLDLYNKVKQNNISESIEKTKVDDTRPKPRLNNESL